MPESQIQDYQPPVAKLLSLGEPPRYGAGLDYASLGIGPEHVPELIRMLGDEKLHWGPSDSQIIWAPVHAWWALGQLRAVAAVKPLLELLRRVDEYDDDWVNEDVPRVLARIGPAAIPEVAEYLGNPAHRQWARVATTEALSKIAQEHPEARAEVIGRLSGQLENFEQNSDTLNAFIVSSLLDLKAVEAAPLMERAFAASRVNEAVHGDWDDAQVELGLKSSREHVRKPNELTRLRDQLLSRVSAITGTTTGAGHAFPDLKAINKARKQARSREKKAKKALLLKRQRRR